MGRMGETKQLYELQQIDLDIDAGRGALGRIEGQLGESSVLDQVRASVEREQQRLAELDAGQRALEWEVEDLGSKIAQLVDKLYSGKVKSPKELVSLERNVDALKARRGGGEDKLLEIMGEVESAQSSLEARTSELKRIEEEWQRQQQSLSQEQAEVKARLSSLEQKRLALSARIDPESLGLYERLRASKGRAVARVERGRCQGCGVTLPVAEWQRARSGLLVGCGNCGRILFLP